MATETMTIEEWRRQALEAGGGDFRKTPFLCPLCGNVATAQDFLDAGADGGRAPQECIGRVIGAKGGLTRKKKEQRLQPCDWAAFGLFGTLDSGIIVTHPDGHQTNSFSFATGR